MPVVPTYNGPQVREQATQGGYQQNIDVSKGARALAAGLGDVAEVADQAYTRQAETTANTADLEISTGWLKWDAENRKKYQGANADGYSAAATEWWGKTAKDYSEKLDPMAKAMVGKSLARRQAASLGQVTQFVEGEKEKHADNTAAANIDTTIQFGVSSGDVAGASARVRELSAQVGARKGWTTEQVQTETLKNLSALHTAQIAKLVELPGGAVAAEAYYQANKTEIGFAQQPKVEQVLKAEVDNQFATQTAAEVAALPLGEQLAVAGKIEDPARREKTIAQIKNNYALVKEVQAEQEKKFADTAWQLVGQGRRVPEAILASMDGKERVQLQEHLRAKAERVASGGGAVKTDYKLYTELRERLAAGENINLAAYTEKIAGSQLEQLLDIKDARAKGGGKAPEARTQEQQLASFIAPLELKGEARGRFESAFGDAVSEHINAKGKAPDYEERKKILDRLTLEGTVEKNWWPDDTKPRWQMTPDEAAKAKFPGDNFITGQVYKDAKGNRAKYLGSDKWETVQ